MNKNRFIAVRDDSCLNCGYCREFVACPGTHSECIGCGICIKGCPQNAIHLQPRTEPVLNIQLTIDEKGVVLPGGLSIREALTELRIAGKIASENGCQSIGCDTGGCWNCEVLVNGDPTSACLTPVRDGMCITTDPDTIRRTEPRRMVTLMRPPPHFHPSIFTHGCNFTCDLCHNWNLTFSSTGRVLSSKETLKQLNLNPEEDYWVGISGGEPTLNRRWLIRMIRNLRQSDSKIRIQLDTNASLLTPDYIDELIEAGMTDISPDLKAFRLNTFMTITGVRAKPLADRYLNSSWNSVRYINDTHSGHVFMAVSVPCHPRTHSMNELKEIANALVAMNPEIPVTLIEYQPAFRLRDWPSVSRQGMDQVRTLFESAGVKQVIIQSGSEMPRAINPLDLALCSEAF